MFEFEPGLIIWTTVSFSILVALLYKFLLPPLLSIIEQRELQIKASIEGAEKSRLDVEILLSEYKRKLEKAHLEANSIIENSKLESQAIVNQAADLAKHEASLILAQARLQIDSSRNTMIKELKDLGAELVVLASTKVLEREVTEKDNLKLITESLNAID